MLLDHLSNIHWVYSIGSIYIAGQLLVLYLLDTFFALVAGLTVNSLWTLGLPSLRVLNQSKCTRHQILTMGIIIYQSTYVYTPLSHLVS